MRDPTTLRAPAGPSGIVPAIERRLGLTPTGLVVVGLAAIGWLAAYAIGSRVMFLMVYGSTALIVALALVGRRKPAIAAHRSELPVRIREGQTVAAELAIEGRRRIGTIVLEERLERIRTPVRVLVASLASGAAVHHRYTFTPPLRGVYRIGPLEAVWSDPFGLTRHRTELAPAAEVIVHPMVEAVNDRVLSREWEDPPIRPPVSKPWPTGFEFYGMREYVPGDDPRRIVWRAVARTGRYLVREAEQGITDRITIVLDNDARRHSRGDPSETFETAVRTVASLGLRHLRDGFLVRVETPSARIAHELRGQRAQLRFLDEMARVELGREPLVKAIARLVGDPRRDTHNILVTPHLDHDAASMLRILVQRGGSMTFVHVEGEDPDPGTLQRAAALGCAVVELKRGAPLETVFRRGTGAGIR